MKLTTRGQICAGLMIGVLTTLGGTQALPNTQENTPGTQEPIYYLERYEDGSGVFYRGETELMTYPDGTFPWSCSTQGDRLCGPTQPE